MTLRGATRTLARAVLPEKLFERVQAIRSRRFQVRLLNTLGLIESAKRYVERNGTIVRYGPFAGMIYPVDAALNRISIPKLLGTYENELHSVIKTVSQRRYDFVIDVGSAEGYYAVGMARLLRVPVYAYDPEPVESNLCSMMARINGVADIVRMGDLFTSADMPKYASQRVFLLCDCEGFEAHLFTADTIQLTSKWDLLIELHGETRESLPRLPWKHTTQVIRQQPRDAETGTFPELAGLGPAAALLSEYRDSEQCWLWCNSVPE